MVKKERVDQNDQKTERGQVPNFDKHAVKTKFRKELVKLRDDYFSGAEAASSMAKKADGAMQSQHDTTKVEQSWLANAFGKMAGNVNEIVDNWEEMIPNRNFKQAEMGALVYLKDLNYNDEEWFYLLPFGGGISAKIDDQKIGALSTESPLGKNLLGKGEGDEVEFELKEKQRFKILKIL